MDSVTARAVALRFACLAGGLIVVGSEAYRLAREFALRLARSVPVELQILIDPAAVFGRPLEKQAAPCDPGLGDQWPGDCHCPLF